MAEGSATTIKEALAQARARLAAMGLDDPGLEARLLVEHFGQTSRTAMLADPDHPIDRETAERIAEAVSRRERHEPVYRIIGSREFYGLDLTLSPDTLDPRPDTETLVDAVLPFVRETVSREGACRILDLGTGTGAIALALLDAVAGATAVGVDISAGALATARGNAERLGLLDRFTALESDWFEKISGFFHGIVSNPPYISSRLIPELQPEVREYDPLLALDGGPDGLDAYRIIAANAARFLIAGGIVGAEIGFDQKTSVSRIFAEAGFALVMAGRDIAGSDRVLIFRPKP